MGIGIPGLSLPTKGSDEAACFDVVATRIEEIEPGKVIIYLGFASEIEKGYQAEIVPRSSFTHQGWTMQNSPAQIDSDYRGEWMIRFEGIPRNIIAKFSDIHPNALSEIQYSKFPYKVGDRCAQVKFMQVDEPEFIIVMEGLQESERGDGGFGSTGNKTYK